jgi:magnesium chelatase subunit I
VDITISTLGELKKAGYKVKSIKDELRDNLIHHLTNEINPFEGIFGFDDTVIPDIERAILSRHNILLLGLRGQAKTKIARLLVNLLDEYIPYITGTEINDDPLKPISFEGVAMVKEHGDNTPISWLHRSERYVEKLATPDVSISDLIGDVDPIKAATLKLPYSDERVIHFGMIPRSHRSIFVINELPDLQARIQVSLFNILQEGDLQIRGFKLRLPLDIQFVFTANPEDYTNRGSIITPLKDRIESQILTHYPTAIDLSKSITKSEAKLHPTQKEKVEILDIHHDVLETFVINARESDFIDKKSGISARLGISAYENLSSTAERRMIKNKEKAAVTRIADFWGIVPAITGKVELVYEGEQEGAYNVALKILNASISDIFLKYFPHPEKTTRRQEKDPYGTIRAFFGAGNVVEIPQDCTQSEYETLLDNVPGLTKLIDGKGIPDKLKHTFMELVLHGLAEFQVIGKNLVNKNFEFVDPLSALLKDDEEVEDY